MIPAIIARKRVKRSVKSTMDDNNGALVTKGQAKQMIQSALSKDVEDKYFDAVTGTSGDIDYAGVMTGSLTDIPQGVADTNRTGDTLTAKRLRWSVLVRYNATNTTTNLAPSISMFRFIIFAWKPFAGDVAPTVAKIMTYTSTAYAAGAPITHDGRDQFVLLHDQQFTLDGISRASKLLKGSKKLNHTIQYKAASTTNGAGKLYAMYISDAVTASGVYPAVTSSSYRTDFVDG